MNTAALVLALVLWALARRRPVEAGALAAMGLAASAIAVALYYRDFLGMVVDLVPRLAPGAAGAPSRYPVQPFWLVAFQRTRDFFDTVYPILAAAGLALMWREPEPAATASASPSARRWLLVGWLGAYVLLLAGRAKAPDIFLHGHETLLVTPLVCLAAGVSLTLAGPALACRLVDGGPAGGRAGRAGGARPVARARGTARKRALNDPCPRRSGFW